MEGGHCITDRIYRYPPQWMQLVDQLDTIQAAHRLGENKDPLETEMAGQPHIVTNALAVAPGLRAVGIVCRNRVALFDQAGSDRLHKPFIDRRGGPAGSMNVEHEP